jgi:hypothetical protein
VCAGAFKYLPNSDGVVDPSLPATPLGEASEISLVDCFVKCGADPNCKGFGVEQRPDLAAKGIVKCWWKNSSATVAKPGGPYFLKQQ